MGVMCLRGFGDLEIKKLEDWTVYNWGIEDFKSAEDPQDNDHNL